MKTLILKEDLDIPFIRDFMIFYIILKFIEKNIKFLINYIKFYIKFYILLNITNIILEKNLLD